MSKNSGINDERNCFLTTVRPPQKLSTVGGGLYYRANEGHTWYSHHWEEVCQAAEHHRRINLSLYLASFRPLLQCHKTEEVFITGVLTLYYLQHRCKTVSSCKSTCFSEKIERKIKKKKDLLLDYTEFHINNWIREKGRKQTAFPKKNKIFYL